MKKYILVGIALLLGSNVCLGQIECDKEIEKLKQEKSELENKLKNQEKTIRKRWEQELMQEKYKIRREMDSLLKQKDKLDGQLHSLDSLKEYMAFRRTYLDSIQSQLLLERQRVQNREIFISNREAELQKKEIYLQNEERHIDSMIAMTGQTQKLHEELEIIRFKNEKEKIEHDAKIQKELDEQAASATLKRQEEENQREIERREREYEEEVKNAQERQKREEAEGAKESARLQVEESHYRNQLPKHISCKFGGKLAWYYGQMTANRTTFEINACNLDACIGYWVNTPLEYDAGTLFGLFTSWGILSKSALQKIIPTNSQNFLSIDPQSYVEVELGVLLNEWFRFSGGYGRQNLVYEYSANNVDYQQYFCCTVGLYIPLSSNVETNLTNTFIIGEAYPNPSMRIGLGVNLIFNFWRW